MWILILPLAVTLVSCSSGQGKKRAVVKDTPTIGSARSSSSANAEKPDYRQEYISSYKEDLNIDTAFAVGDTTYRVHFRHYCTWDSGLLVPARYNFDTKKDFLTHHFESELVLLRNGKTAFRKTITKKDFAPLLYPGLEQYGTLLFPGIEIQNDSISLFYSISIPVTDVGISAAIHFDSNGNFRVK